ncbi:unnamed protein product [Lactuca virosa]|uniref:RRM domain-containing protein n=1 Tax=Lactuca virosa TaxID=75947 RepID=A0AAU9M1Y1_9ASTR|nr:unnamed protein product [Lactuca virosa]
MDGWTEVRRRKTPAKFQTGLDETSFFVSNIPTGATKEEFRKIFNLFGGLTDIYFGGKKGRTMPKSSIKSGNKSHTLTSIPAGGGFAGSRTVTPPDQTVETSGGG